MNLLQYALVGFSILCVEIAANEESETLRNVFFGTAWVSFAVFVYTLYGKV